MSHIASFVTLAQAIESLLHPYAEVVIHDLGTGQIHSIYNNLSRRSEGEASNLECNPTTSKHPQDTKGPYERLNWDGRLMKSISSLLRDDRRRPVGLMCINLDISQFDAFKRFLEDFMDKTQQRQAANDPFSDDWQRKIKDFIQDYLEKNRLQVQTLSRTQKRSLVQFLSEKGAFRGKNAAALIGQILHLSRATVYKYLGESSKSAKKRNSA